jgi:hypothetical protein
MESFQPPTDAADGRTAHPADGNEHDDKSSNETATTAPNQAATNQRPKSTTSPTPNSDPSAMTTTLEAGDIVEVTWTDAGSWSPGWQTPDELANDADSHGFPARTVGYLIHQDDTRVVVAQNRQDDGTKYADCMTIPTAMTPQIRRLA